MGKDETSADLGSKKWGWGESEKITSRNNENFWKIF